jgi:membrane fusion protein, multidrug efflux system
MGLQSSMQAAYAVLAIRPRLGALRGRINNEWAVAARATQRQSTPASSQAVMSKPADLKSAKARGTRLLLAALAIALVLALAIALFTRMDRSSTVATAPVQPIPVIGAVAQQREMPIVLIGLGTVTALNTATVHSQITGLLINVDFQEGQPVKKGDLLAQIDPRTYQAQLEQVEATLNHDQTHLSNAQLNLARYSELAKTDSIARQQVDDQTAAVSELTAQIKNDQAAIQNAKAQLSYTKLVAPFDGITGIRLLDVGNIIHPPTAATAPQSGSTDSNALVVVTQVQPISVIFPLATTSISEIQAAMANGPLEATAYSQDGKTKLDTGKLVVVNNQADPGSGTVQLKAVFPNERRQLWPGAFVNVHLIVSTQQGLTVPLDAVQQGPQGMVVYVVGQDHKISIRPVSMRESLNGVALIEKGLNAGETVVVRGQYRLSPGSLVTLASPDDPGAVPNPSTASAGMLP